MPQFHTSRCHIKLVIYPIIFPCYIHMISSEKLHPNENGDHIPICLLYTHSMPMIWSAMMLIYPKSKKNYIYIYMWRLPGMGVSQNGSGIFPLLIHIRIVNVYNDVYIYIYIHTHVYIKVYIYIMSIYPTYIYIYIQYIYISIHILDVYPLLCPLNPQSPSCSWSSGEKAALFTACGGTTGLGSKK